MQPQSTTDYKQLLTEVIKKQIVILGPDITLSKARNVKGLTVSPDGTVTEVVGDPQLIVQALIDQFVQLSGLIVKKTMEPLLAISQVSTPAGIGSQEQLQPAAPAQPIVEQPPVAQPAAPIPVQQPQPMSPQPIPVPRVEPTVPAEPTIPPEPNPLEPAPSGADTRLEPAKNPLAA